MLYETMNLLYDDIEGFEPKLSMSKINCIEYLTRTSLYPAKAKILLQIYVPNTLQPLGT